MAFKIMDVGCEQDPSVIYVWSGSLGWMLTFRGPVKSWLPQCLGAELGNLAFVGASVACSLRLAGSSGVILHNIKSHSQDAPTNQISLIVPSEELSVVWSCRCIRHDLVALEQAAVIQTPFPAVDA